MAQVVSVNNILELKMTQHMKAKVKSHQKSGATEKFYILPVD